MAPTLINFDGQTVFKVPVSGSFTVPETRVMTSPTDNTNFDSIRGIVGGQLLGAYDDVATSDVQHVGQADQTRLYPGDIIDCSAVGVPAANQVTVTITSREGTQRSFVLSGVTVVAGVLGIYG